MARMAKFVMGRRFMVTNNVTITVTVRTSLTVRVGLWIMGLGAWVCGITLKREEA